MKVSIIPSNVSGAQAASYRAFLDGKDVSNQCFEADDELGYVHVYKRNEEGKIYKDGDTAAWECLRGNVRIEATK